MNGFTATRRWRQQVEITRHGSDVSQALEKQSHWQLRLMSQVTQPDAFAWLRFVANQVCPRVCHGAVKRSLVGSSYGASLNAPCRQPEFSFSRAKRRSEQLVADPAHGLEQRLALRFELGSQAAHVHVEQVGVDI